MAAPTEWRAAPTTTAGRRSSRPPAVLVVPALIAAAVALLPLVYLVVRSLDSGVGELISVLWRERTVRLTVRSLGLAAAVTFACLVLGVSLAWLTVRTTLPGRRGWAVARRPAAGDPVLRGRIRLGGRISPDPAVSGGQYSS